ncbi:MAG: hypothetical protein HEQ25_21055 [Dolichospermum sp. DET73]|nr:hypothetical protein [Dolichospermum sp. DET73]
MNQVVKFSTSTIPAKIDIRHFFNKKIAYEMTIDYDENLYFYDGELTGAKEHLESIGFSDVKIVGLVNWEEMKPCFNLPAVKNPDIDFFNRNVPKQFLIDTQETEQ